MGRQLTSWYQGWKITLRCTEFKRQDGSKRFVSSATLQHSPAQSGQASLHRSEVIARSKIHSDHAFCSCEEAEADAVERAKLEISGLAGELEFDQGQFLENSRGTVASSESDESLASRFEITFDGKRYAFRQYRYDQFRDALRYAMLEHTKDGFLRDEAFRPNWASAYRPSDREEGAMRRHCIVYVDGRYLYAGYCYSRLSDAIAYAEGHPNQ
jgi:hypothetical protein